MEITMSKNAVETLIEKVGENTKIALALINDSDPFLRDKCAFAKGSFFQIIPFVSEFGEYATKIEHPLLDIYTSKLEQNYFGKRLNMDFNRIRQKSPILYRWVMNAVRYEGYRW
ncbi:iron-sulfur cluster biosynthesis family protein [Enterococcus faecium]|uniref:iron-sulfur cluster biosynthesis family protein n=1 Tax=Enterococcus faecium TaxID=1352 RepID=UPI002A35FB43|nr:iron-sulfur cluster biosynthesis family protein [Enterococcus faecium]